MLTRPSALAVLPALVLATHVAAAQSSTSVLPNIPVHVEAPRATDTIVYARTVTRAGVDSASGMRTVALRAMQAEGERLLEVVQRFPGGGGEIVDTAVAALATLRAVRHASHQPTRTMRFTFADGRATGSVTLIRPAGDSTIAVDQSLGGPIFDSNIIELVVASLPLRAGFAADVPFFIYERGGRVTMPVAVRERAMLAFPEQGTRDAWVVSVGVPGAPATVWVDAATHVVLRVRYDIAARAMSFTDDRVTPIPL